MAPGGVWVVDAKTHHGKLEVRKEGGLFTPRQSRLYIRGRDKTDLIEGVVKQVAVVRDVLDDAGFPVEVHGALCFVGTELPWRDVSIDGIPLIGRRGLAKRLAAPGPVGSEQVRCVADALNQALPNA